MCLRNDCSLLCTAVFMILVTCGLTVEDRDQLRNPREWSIGLPLSKVRLCAGVSDQFCDERCRCCRTVNDDLTRGRRVYIGRKNTVLVDAGGVYRKTYARIASVSRGFFLRHYVRRDFGCSGSDIVMRRSSAASNLRLEQRPCSSCRGLDFYRLLVVRERRTRAG